LQIGNAMELDPTGSRFISLLIKTELALLHMVALEGMRNVQIAEVFGVTESNVRNKLRRVFNVMGMDSRLQMATFVHRSPALRAAAADAYREAFGDRE
jgi:DNA-binding CsgD family transcriptional regulator